MKSQGVNGIVLSSLGSFIASNVTPKTNTVFQHLKDARLAGAPITMNADGYWRVWRFTDETDDGLRDRLVVEEVGCRLLVVQEHEIILPSLLKRAKPLFRVSLAVRLSVMC
jgi:hypothetical protein